MAGVVGDDVGEERRGRGRDDYEDGTPVGDALGGGREYGGEHEDVAVDVGAHARSHALYVERFLRPNLKDGQEVVMDNLQLHKTKRVRELIEGRGYSLVFWPPYSPDFNPIEEAFSKVKALLRRAKARSFEALAEATGGALCAVSERDALGFFAHCGYAIPRAHSL